ncbi:MAG: hypothetical protein H0X38_04775 [Planctomycetes bacterium]|nr:hypothetical protein [Planctomycetota bacterium]
MRAFIGRIAFRLPGLRAALALLAVTALTAAGAEGLLAAGPGIPIPAVSGRIDHFAQDVAGKRLFVAALGNGTVEVIDLASGTVVHTIDHLDEPQGVAWLPDLGRLVIAEGGGDAVDVLDGTTWARLGRIEHLGDADNIRVEAKTGLVYVGVGSGRSAALALIDAKSATLMRTLPLPGHPEAFALETAGPRIYVNVPDDGSVVVLDRSTGATAARWELAGASSNFPMALDEAAHRLFVACRSPARLVILDTATGSQISSLPCASDADDVFRDAAAQRVYVIGGGGEVTVIGASDPLHYDVLAAIPTVSGARTGFFDAAAGRLYVACPRHIFGKSAEIRTFAAPHP